MYEYAARVDKVVDGDTCNLSIDLGFCIYYAHSCRLFGINAAEHGTPAGDAAKLFLEGLLPVGTLVIVRTQKNESEKYGRILGTIVVPPKKTRKKGVVVPTPVSINDQLVAAGHAIPWDGKGARPV